jgi:uncharacterized membrane protein YdbT with pleckstrin-like domain
MGYIEKSISTNEKIIKLFHINKYMFVTPYLLIGGAFILLIIGKIVEETYKMPFVVLASMTLLMGLLVLLNLKNLEYGVTSERIIMKKGIISRYTDELLLSAVETIEVRQSILGRLLGFGTVIITGRGNSIVKLESVDDPLIIKKIIEEKVFDYKNS